jgi:hypothetical protein
LPLFVFLSPTQCAPRTGRTRDAFRRVHQAERCG